MAVDADAPAGSPGSNLDAVFVSYRRGDAGAHALQITDALRARFKNDVFLDVYKLQAGDDAFAKIDAAMERVGVMVAVIGPRWLRAVPEIGHRRRIDLEDDWIAYELNAARQRSIPVIPVYVDGCEPVKDAEWLLEPTRSVFFSADGPGGRRQARLYVQLSHDRWESDLRSLLDTLEQKFRLTPNYADLLTLLWILLQSK